MKVEITERPEEVILKISGRLDTNSSADFEKAIEPILNENGLKVKVDCSDLTYISSSGLRIFLLLQKTVSHKGGSLCLCCLSEDVKDVLDVTGFSSIFKIV